MQRRAGILCAVVAVTAVAASCHPTDAPKKGDGHCDLEFTDRGSVRVFVIGHGFRADDALTYDSFERSYRDDVAEVSDCLSSTRPNLIVFPEDAGLIAWFIGQRALLARHASDSATAFNAAFAAYFRRADAYAAKFPGLSSARALTLALGDTAWRAMDRTFGGIAKDLDAWVITSANLPDAELTFDAAQVARFGDPDVAAEEGAYVARTGDVFNMALLYGPDGVRQGRVDKVFLTDPEEQALDLSNGSLEKLAVFDLPFAKVGAAISRDAFYAPFMQRLDDLGVDFVVQPEAFSGWTIEELEGDWLPTVFLSSGWSHTQKYRSFRHNATPILAGNLYELLFDGQVSITQKAAPGQTAHSFVGTQPLPGFVGIGPWAMEDPAQGTLEERRGALRAKGEALRPGSHAKDEGAYPDTLVAADLSFYGPLEAPPAHDVTSTRTRAVAPSAAGHQTNPALVPSKQGGFCAVWSDTREGPERLYFACSSADGRTWLPARAVTASGTAHQRRAALTSSPADGALVVAWQEEEEGTGSARVRTARLPLGAAQFEAPVDVEGASAAAQWEPAVAFSRDGAEVTLTWTDFREGLAPRVRYATSSDGARTWSASARVAPDGAQGRFRPTQLQPSVAYAPEGPVVAWLDYREGDWQVWAARRVNGAFEPLRITQDERFELLSSDPRVAPSPTGVLIVWDDLRQRRAHHDVRGAVLEGANLTPLPSFPGGSESGVEVSRFRPDVAFREGDGPLTVFQDLTPGKNALYLSDGTRLDDTGEAANQLTRPRVAVSGGSALVVFEDDREGWSRIYATDPF